MELKYANNKLIGEEAKSGSEPDFRKIMAGSMPGSDYYIVGGITQLDFNIGSNNVSANGGQTTAQGIKGGIGGSMYVMSIAIDMRLVDTTTLEVVDNISYQKQIIARQLNGGVFDFLGQHFFDISAGVSQQEPIQLGVRSVIERATLEMMLRLYRMPSNACAAANDPMADPRDNRASLAAAAAPEARPAPQPVAAQPAPAQYQVTPANYQTAYAPPPAQPAYAPQPAQRYAAQPAQAYAPQSAPKVNQEKYNDESRQDPYRWYGDRDPAAAISLRGRQ